LSSNEKVHRELDFPAIQCSALLNEAACAAEKSK